MGKKATRSKTVAKKPAKAPKKKAVASPKKAVRKVTKKAIKKVKSAPKRAVKKAPPKKEKAPKLRTAKKSKAVASGPKGYTAAEYERFKEFVKKFNGKTNQELKDLLRQNLQSMSGNKDDLVYKCADGATLGRIPRCPNCFGGRYIFSYLDLNSITKQELTTALDTETTLTSKTAIHHLEKMT